MLHQHHGTHSGYFPRKEPLLVSLFFCLCSKPVKLLASRTVQSISAVIRALSRTKDHVHRRRCCRCCRCCCCCCRCHYCTSLIRHVVSIDREVHSNAEYATWEIMSRPLDRPPTLTLRYDIRSYVKKKMFYT